MLGNAPAFGSRPTRCWTPNIPAPAFSSGAGLAPQSHRNPSGGCGVFTLLVQGCTRCRHAAECVKDRLANLGVDVVTLGLGLADVGLEARRLAAVVDALEVIRQGLAIGERTLEEQGTNDVEDCGGRLVEVPRCVDGVGEHTVLLVKRLVVVENLLLLRGKAKGHLLLQHGSLGAGVRHGQGGM